MKTVKLALAVLVSSVFGTLTSFAAPYPEVSCNNLPSSNSCSQCFDAGAIYEWWSRKGLYDEFVNDSSNTFVYFEKENQTPYTIDRLQSTTEWKASNPLFKYVNNSPYSAFWFTSKAGDLYHIFAPNFTDKYIQSDTNDGIHLVSVKDGTKADTPALVLRVHTNYRKSLWGWKVGDMVKHTECFYYSANWCGDGKLQSDKGEQCDPKDPNKTGWGNGGCDASCKPINTPVEQPKCNSQYNGQTVDNLVAGPHLCSVGTYANFKFNAATNTWTWTCNGVAGTTPAQCSAKKKPAPVEDPKCNSQYNGQIHYNKNYPQAWLNSGMPLCKPGEVFSFLGPDAKGVYTWGCKVGNKKTESNECQARELRCGDGIVQQQYGEECDPKAPNQSSDKVCNNKCKWENKPVYDLALTKKLATNKKKYELGDLVDFTITVYNQENLAAKNIEVTEYIPEGLILEDAKWTKNGDKATRIITQTIQPGQKLDLSLTMRISKSFKGTKILNKAEISKDNSGDYGTTDKDSTPDQNPNNDCIVGEDNHYIDGDGKKGGDCTPATDEDDHDVVPLIVEPDTPIIPPFIEKELEGDKNHKYKVGELVGFRMPFGNTGSKTIYNVSIKDFLPLNLEYVSSEIHGVSPYTKGLYLSGGVQVLEYSGFDLAPGQKGYLLLTGRVLSGHQDVRENRVGIYVNNILVDYATAEYPLANRAVKIEKTVDKNQVFSGETVEFTLKVSNLTGEFDTLKVVDTLPKGLVFIPNTQFLTGQTTETTVVSFATGVNKQGLTTLTWELKFPKGFKKSDSFLLKFKSKLVETSKTKYTNIACVFNPDDPTNPNCDPEDVMPKLEDVQLKIKKYVSTAITGPREDNRLNMDNGTAYFKLVISGATAPLTGFRVTDRIEGNLTFDTGSWLLPDNAFTGVITFWANNANKPAYTITPTVSWTQPTDIVWKVEMNSGYFMSGDALTIIIKTQKKGDQKNIAHVYYPKPGGKEGHDEDPAEVYKTTSGWGGWGWGGYSGGWGWYNPSCGNGKKDGNEICDLGGKGTIGSDGKLFKYTDEYDKNYVGYTCNANCRLEKDGEKIAPQCFNVQNGSISIMKGEVLPFYWNMQAQLGMKTVKEKQDWLRNNFAYNCEDKDANRKIELGSMECEFAVYGPWKNNSSPVYTFTTKCINLEGWNSALSSTYPAISDWISQNMKGWFGGSELANKGLVKNVFASLDNQNDYPILLPLSSKLFIKKFWYNTSLSDWTRLPWTPNGGKLWEYKLSLKDVGYRTCTTDEKGKGKSGTLKWEGEEICEVNFAVTDPYLVQKSPYGEVSSSTPLRNYQTKRGEPLFKTDKNVNASNYKVPASLGKTYDRFVAKYSKLAKKVKGNLKKVPGKSIYFVEGDQQIDLQNMGIATDKPFTLIAKNGADILIKGSLYSNAMIMTKGHIIFDAKGSCNGDLTKYGHAGQMVKGIFYAGKGFGSSNHENLKNTAEKLSKSERCNYGNLHIKGVAIGDLTDVVKNRRSELYTWFKWNGGGKSPEEKRDIVINGASVLVEYNPSLRGNLPPGAEEFNKALAVYRK